MRLLIIEDDEVLADALAKRVLQQLPRAAVTITHALSDGTHAINAEVFDAAVIDLRLPSEPGAGDAAIENGLAIEATLAAAQPGVLRLFATASEAEVVVEQLRHGKAGDFFASGERLSVVDYVRKDGVAALDRCTERIVAHAARLEALDAVELEGSDDLPLDAKRALAITVRLVGGIRGRVLRRVGLSGAVTALVECVDDSGRSVGNAFCKCGPPDTIRRELRGYKLAQFQLPTTSFPPLAKELSVGTGASRALVFTKAPTGKTFFDLADDDPSEASDYVDKLPEVLNTWHDQARIRRTSLHSLIDNVLSDEVATRYAERLLPIRLEDIGHVELDLFHYCQHGDLHGANLFVASGNNPFLIDFAHTGPQFGPADQVSLELGLLFHPESPFHGRLSDEECEGWLSEDATRSDDLGPILTACRRWADSQGHKPRAHATATLLYALWILNHTEQVGPAIAIAVAASKVILA